MRAKRMADTKLSRWAQPAVILVASDLDDLDRLMPFALSQAARTKAHLILLHVLAAGSTLSIDERGTPLYDPALAIEQSEVALQPWCEVATQRGIVCDAVVRDGQPARQIAAAARQFHADRILIGTRNRDKKGKSPLGSVAEQVLRSVNLPVITVGPEAHLPVEAGDPPPIVLHATNLRETSRPSAALACQIASRLGYRLILMHVLPPGRGSRRSGQPAAADEPVRERLRQLTAETAADCNLAVEPLVVHGNPFVEVLAAASECGADLIVLGLTPHSIFENLTRDRVVYQVVAHACCPVITLREHLPASVELPQEATAAAHI
jgi:nucleotide-binding universal stress UspA family protein